MREVFDGAGIGTGLGPPLEHALSPNTAAANTAAIPIRMSER